MPTPRSTPYGLGAYSLAALRKEGKERDYTRDEGGKFSDSPGGGGAKEKPAPKKPKKAPPEKKPTGAEAQAANVASVGEVLNANDDERLGANGLNQLSAFADGKALSPEAEAHMVKQGLVKLDADGVATLTAEGRAVVTAAKKGDADAVGAALDNAGKRVNAAAGRQADADAKAKEKTDAEAKAKADADAKAKEKEKGGGGGGGGSKGEEKKPAEEKDKADPKAKALAANRQKVVDAMADADEGLSPSGAKALLGFADGGKLDGEQSKALAAMGLVEIDSKGGARLSAEGRAAAAAMGRGDTRSALDAISRAADKAPKPKATPAPKKDEDGFRRTRKASLPYGVGAYVLAKHGSHNQKKHGRRRGKGATGGAVAATPAQQRAQREIDSIVGVARVRQGIDRPRNVATATVSGPARVRAPISGDLDAQARFTAQRQADAKVKADLRARERQLKQRKAKIDAQLSGADSPKAPKTPAPPKASATPKPPKAQPAPKTTLAQRRNRLNEIQALVQAGGLSLEQLRALRAEIAGLSGRKTKKALESLLAKRAPSPLSAYAPISKADEGERLVYGVGAYVLAKHGSHNQKRHGRATARRRASVAAYRDARAQGASVADARAQAKGAGLARQGERDARLQRMRERKDGAAGGGTESPDAMRDRHQAESDAVGRDFDGRRETLRQQDEDGRRRFKAAQSDAERASIQAERRDIQRRQADLDREERDAFSALSDRQEREISTGRQAAPASPVRDLGAERRARREQTEQARQAKSQARAREAAQRAASNARSPEQVREAGATLGSQRRKLSAAEQRQFFGHAVTGRADVEYDAVRDTYRVSVQSDYGRDRRSVDVPSADMARLAAAGVTLTTAQIDRGGNNTDQWIADAQRRRGEAR